MAKRITYKKSGVDIDKADKLISRITPLIKTTRNIGSIGSIGGFGGFFDPMKYGIKDPVLVSCVDGVGTKLKIAVETGKFDTVGIDLVAMCVNDCVTTGARPLFFLDYFATGRLNGKIWEDTLKGIVKACGESGCALLGGETAEMPGMYNGKDYDLAGFTVGIVDRKKIIDGKTIKPGDVILALPSNGLHSNGFSLVRKLFSKKETVEKKAMFLKPTRIYVKPVLDVLKKVQIKGIAHITGGGLYDNIPRILPGKCRALINKGTWNIPSVFKKIVVRSGLGEKELYRTFNMGIGMILVTGKKDAGKAADILKKKHKINARVIGNIEKGRRGVVLV